MTTPPPTDKGQTVLLSFDLEDWDQVEGTRLGHRGLNVPRVALERRMRAVFGLLDSLRARATFFCLGRTMTHYPGLVAEIVDRGDEIACHGFEHEPVYRRSPEAFRADLLRALETLERLGAPRPIGYRAPSFSINRTATWALDLLFGLGFEYDSSLHDSPRIPSRMTGIPAEACPLQLPGGGTLWEIPPATHRTGRWALPIGGGAYWRVLPHAMLSRAISAWPGRYLPLYFHPHECDPVPLRVPLPNGAGLRARAKALRLNLQFGVGRRGMVTRIRRLLEGRRVVTYAEGLSELRATGTMAAAHVRRDGSIGGGRRPRPRT